MSHKTIEDVRAQRASLEKNKAKNEKARVRRAEKARLASRPVAYIVPMIEEPADPAEPVMTVFYRLRTDPNARGWMSGFGAAYGMHLTFALAVAECEALLAEGKIRGWVRLRPETLIVVERATSGGLTPGEVEAALITQFAPAPGSTL